MASKENPQLVSELADNENLIRAANPESLSHAIKSLRESLRVKYDDKDLLDEYIQNTHLYKIAAGTN